MRKSIYTSFILLLLAVAGLQSCKKSDNETPTVSYTVNVSFPNNYATTKAANAEVTLTNSTTNVKVTATSNADGVAAFTGLLPGNYQVTASRTLTAAEALVQTGFETEVFLNASATNQLIAADASLDLKLQGSKVGGLVFKQIYYTGSKTPANGNYQADQFYEIYNNSPEVIYADSLYLGESGGTPGISASATPFAFSKTAGNVYLQNVWMIPGTGKSHPIEPGASIVISSNGIHHKTDAAGNVNSVDLGAGISDFEGYVASTGRDVDNQAVPNMDLPYFAASTFTWLTSVYGPGMVIFKTKDFESLNKLQEPGSSNARLYVEVPGSDVIDAMEALANANAVNFKRIPAALDAGFAFCTGTYNRQAIIRKITTTVNGRRVLQDTNNSSADFVTTTNILPKGWQ
ncbi:hypothetical protein PBAL39_13170 [Pedobacter sp. BAL39]|uniref:DUF4876 domain-containing protein n=1 Tax=Pedobacter sp. BAL39 TaxID=391596 RepID=UPI0001559678|nr:DUF4876 domain-containing protein [Pedobacter sp. BAL39]EDM35422.1 hypothetical protein PBAL39_13170 [Pedobacter sp. BAL39]